ncbi:hypothetical protein DMX02_10145 [Pseudomonas jessenii]|nr:hypothetical protein DMX02_10145 [Pseudomonas jessenii]
MGGNAISATLTNSVGASLLAKAVGQSVKMLNGLASSRASSLPQGGMVVVILWRCRPDGRRTRFVALWCHAGLCCRR